MSHNINFLIRKKGHHLAILFLLLCTAGAWAWGMQAGAIEPVWGWWRIGVLSAALMTTYLFIRGLDNPFVWVLLIYLPVVIVSMAVLWLCLASIYAAQVILPEAGFLVATLNIVTVCECFLLLFGVTLHLMGDAH